MVKGFNSDIVDEIKSRCDLVAIVSEQIMLEKRGNNYVGLCPFHQEKTPSFNVSPEKQLYHCFGCGASGDLFSFLMHTDNISFPEALKLLADKVGVALPEEKKENRELDSIKERYLLLHESALNYYRFILHKRPEGKKALWYLKKRGISDKSLDTFGIGFAPVGWDLLLKTALKKGYSAEELIAAGLVGKSSETGKHFDRFRNRIMFPIRNIRGQVIGFGGRIIDEKEKGPKYLNSPATLIFDKRKVLYGIDLALGSIRKNKQAIIVEGYTDVILLHQEGFNNVVASMGTALTSLQARILRAQTEEVVIAYDADTAGEAASERGMDILKNSGCTVRVVALPEGFDPDSFIREKGKKVFEDSLKKSLPLTEYRLQRIKKKYNISQPEGKLLFIKEVMPVIISLENELERDEYLKRLSEEMDLSEKALRSEIKKYKNLYGKNSKEKPENITIDENIVARTSEINPAEKVILSLLFAYEGVYDAIIEKINDDIFSPDVAKIIDACKTFNDEGKKLKSEQLMNCFSDDFLQKFIAELDFKSPWEGFSDKEVLKIVDDCIKKLKINKLAAHRRKIEKKIKAAEKAGTNGESVKLLLSEWESLKLAEQKL